MNTDAPEVNLFLDRRTADIPKNVGKWLRRLVRDALADGAKIETTWILSRDLVVVELDCGLQTSVEITCTFESWTLDKDRVSLTVDPLTTATILECIEGDSRGCQLSYGDGLLTVRAGSRPYQLTARAALIKSIQTSNLCTAEVRDTRTAISAEPTHERGK